MISPEEYIKRYRRCNSNHMFQNDEIFAHIVNNLYIGPNMHFKEVYSSNIYPQYIRLGDQHLFLWDNFYWDLLEAHIQCKILLQESKCNRDFCTIYFTGMVYLFLSFRLEKYPYLSLAIVEESQLWREQISLRYNSDQNLQHIMKVSNANIKEQILLCKLFVFLHEHTHFLYSNPKNFEIDKKNMVDFSKRILSIEKVNLSDGFLVLAIEKLASGEDLRLLEETCCDLRAITELTRLFNKVFDTETPIDKEHHFILTHVLEVQKFQHLVMQIEQVWQAFYLSFFDKTDDISNINEDWERKFKKKRTEDQALVTARYQFIHLASCLLPEFILDASKDHMRKILFLSNYENEEYSNFSNTICEYFCNEHALFAINARGLHLEHIDKICPQEALETRNKLVGWRF